jgi:4a-hydroxytetrahydrobiopterin dehydratase
MERRRLSEAERDALLASLPQWRMRGEVLRRELVFRDFHEAFAFMTRVAEEAEALDHHPDWHNAYNRLVIELTTHDLHALSPLDAELARRIEALLEG